MIKSEGYLAFRGTMRITYRNPQFPAEEIHGDWLYKPEYDCWYANGRSYPAEICDVVEDETS